MNSTNNPEVFAERWHNHIKEIKKLKMSLDPEQFEELDEALNEIHDLVDEAAEEVSDDG